MSTHLMKNCWGRVLHRKSRCGLFLPLPLDDAEREQPPSVLGFFALRWLSCREARAAEVFFENKNSKNITVRFLDYT